MALTEIKTSGIDDDAVTAAKIANGAIDSTDQLTNGVVTAAKMEQVGASNDGKYLRANNGAPCSWETVSAGTTLSGSTDNTVVTVTGANAIQGEANLIFDGTNLGVGTTPSYLTHIKKDTSGGAAGTKVVIENAATDSVNNNVELYLKTARGDFGFKHYNATESYIQVPDQLIINTNNATSATQALHIDTSQNVKVSNGNLVIGTSGKGIDFSAHADVASGETTTSSVLDDYEEGTFTAKMGASTNYDTYEVTGLGNYIKIGTMVTVNFRFHNVNLNNSASGTIYLFNMPFTGNNFSATNSKAGTSADWNGYNISFNTDYQYAFYIEPSTNTWQGRGSRNGTTWIDWTVDNFISSNTYLDFTGSYRVA